MYRRYRRRLRSLEQRPQQRDLVGKSPLVGSPIGINFYPGADLMRWAVMINYVIYEVIGGDEDDDGVCIYNISTCDKLREAFHWYATDFKCLCSN